MPGQIAEFRGNRRLKFTHAEQEAIHSAERTLGYRPPQQQSRSNAPRLIAKALLVLLIVTWLRSCVAPLFSFQTYSPAPTASTTAAQFREPEQRIVENPPPSLSPQVQEQSPQSAPVLPSVAAEVQPSAEVSPAADMQGEQAPDSGEATEASVEVPLPDDGESGTPLPQLVTAESKRVIAAPRQPYAREIQLQNRFEFASTKEMFGALAQQGYLEEFNQRIRRHHWMKIKAKLATVVLEEPRFDAAFVARIPPHRSYYAIDTHLPCSPSAGVTWKLAWVPGSDSDKGMVCTLQGQTKIGSFFHGLARTLQRVFRKRNLHDHVASPESLSSLQMRPQVQMAHAQVRITPRRVPSNDPLHTDWSKR
jgi:hypothetical protein